MPKQKIQVASEAMTGEEINISMRQLLSGSNFPQSVSKSEKNPKLKR
jgi:hypothetical protein